MYSHKSKIHQNNLYKAFFSTDIFLGPFLTGFFKTRKLIRFWGIKIFQKFKIREEKLFFLFQKLENEKLILKLEIDF